MKVEFELSVRLFIIFEVQRHFLITILPSSLKNKNPEVILLFVATTLGNLLIYNMNFQALM